MGFPSVVGPFNVFDARVFVSQAVVDLKASNDARAAGHELTATRHDYRDARELVVLVAGNLYLQAVIANTRAESARAQRDTADALYSQAVNLRKSGLVAGIDVVRAEVRLSTERQRATASENEFQKAKLQLARAIGLPPGQPFVLTDTIPYSPVPEISLDDALERAYRQRPDYLALLERVQAAEAARRAGRRRTAAVGPRDRRLRRDRLDAAVVPAHLQPRRRWSTCRCSKAAACAAAIAQAESEVRLRRAEADDARRASTTRSRPRSSICGPRKKS